MNRRNNGIKVITSTKLLENRVPQKEIGDVIAQKAIRSPNHCATVAYEKWDACHSENQHCTNNIAVGFATKGGRSVVERGKIITLIWRQ